MKKALIFALSLMLLAAFAVGCTAKDAEEAATAAPTVEAQMEATEEVPVTAEPTEETPAAEATEATTEG